MLGGENKKQRNQGASKTTSMLLPQDLYISLNVVVMECGKFSSRLTFLSFFWLADYYHNHCYTLYICSSSFFFFFFFVFISLGMLLL
jgi:hypothetical protein